MVDLWKLTATSGERNFIERIILLIFLETVKAIEMMQEPQFNLEKKESPSMLNNGFSSKTDPSIITPTAPDLVHQSNKIR